MPVFQSRKKSIVADRSEGVSVYSGGDVYTDAISGMFNMPFGYGFQPVVQRVQETLLNLSFHPKENFYSQEVIQVAEELLSLSKTNNGAVLFLNSGSEAIEASLATAMLYHRANGDNDRVIFLAYRHSYHGATQGARSVTGRSNFNDIIYPGYRVRGISPPYDRIENGTQVEAGTIDEVKKVIDEVGADRIAGIITEPTWHLKGMRPMPVEYAKQLARLCGEANTLLIFDEIVTGAFRTGPFLNCHKLKIQPDIVALGKGICGGYLPASAMVAQEHVAERFEQIGNWRMHPYSHTFAGSAPSIAGVSATLLELKKVNSSGQLSVLAEALENAKERIAEHPMISRVERNGLILGATISGESDTNSGKDIENACFKRKVVIRGDEDWFCLLPSYLITKQELDIVVTAVLESLNELEQSLQNKRIS